MHDVSYIKIKKLPYSVEEGRELELYGFNETGALMVAPYRIDRIVQKKAYVSRTADPKPVPDDQARELLGL